jgi:hypothetical protein
MDIITLSEAKIYLRIDDTLTEDDAQIQRMVNSAFSYIEKYTNVYLRPTIKDYFFNYGKCLVYDYPINTVVNPEEFSRVEKQQYSIFSSSLDKVSLNIGYSDIANVPTVLIDVAYEILDILYYQHETGKSVKTDLSSVSVTVLDEFKRFII